MDTSWDNSGSLTNKTKLLKFIKMLHQNQNVRGLRYQSDRSVKTTAATGAFEIAARTSIKTVNAFDL